ncbi:MAG TPA: O-antigen ligase family protein [Nitrospirae bacterium]|nr:O-antigen ligase family protein [Nitrospirota bacterium]
MPPKLAFILCTAFVAYLLKLDYHRFKEQSITIWIPTIWILYCASKSFGLWFNISSSRDIESMTAAIIAGSPMDRSFLLSMIIVGLIILARRKINWHKIFVDNRWLLLLFFYMLVSILWSDYPFVSVKRWIRASGTIVMALVVLTGPSPLAGIESIFRRMIYILIPFSALLVKYFPEYGVQYGRWSGEASWVGTAIGKNGLGVLCMISALVMIWTFAKSMKQTKRPSDYYETMANVVVLGLTFWLLKGPGGAYSATSIVTLIVGIITLFTLRSMKSITKWNLILPFGLAFMLMSFLSINPVALVASLTGRDVTLTGRADMIWSQLIPVFQEHPVIGTGYGGFWISPLSLGPKLTINQAHNGYLDILIELGIVGLILFIIVMIAFYKKAADEFKFDIEWGSFLLTFLLMSLLHNYTESTYIKSTALIWNVLIMLMVACPRKIGSIPRKVINQ